jgi:hypothetical protein
MVLFEDLLSAQDLREAANALVREFREQHDLPPIHQLGLVVADVQLAAQTLEARGMGPFFITHGAASMWREHGEEHHFRGKMGLAYHRGFELELLQPGEGSNFYRQSLDTVGRIVVQHLGFSVMDVDAWANRLTASSGYPIWVRGRLQSGPLHVDFAYMDTIAQAGLIVEFISWRVFGVLFSPPAAILHSIGRLQKWSGKRSMPL